MPTIKDILIAAKKRISDPRRWTKGAWARDLNHVPCASSSSEACSWCAIGAVAAATTKLHNRLDSPYSVLASAKADAMLKLAAFTPVEGICVAVFNDNESTTHEDIMKLFDKAIASC